MKKHPVDDLFRRRLSDLERTPSANAWQRIEERKTSRKKSGWIWYAAASILVGVLAGSLIILNQKGQHAQHPVAYETETAGGEKARKLPETSGDILAQIPDSKSSVTERRFEEEAKPSKSIDSVAKQLLVENAPKPGAELARHEDVASQPRILQIKPAGIEVKPDFAEVTPKIEEPAIAQTLQAVPEPTRTIVVTVETEEQEAQPRVSKFSRVFRQLKNARAGERVDWEEVGFNPRDLFAKADDRFKHKEEKHSDKDQTSRQHQTFN